MYFRTVVNISFTFSYVNLISTFLCICPHYIYNHVHVCLLLLSMSLYVCHLLVRISLWNQWRYCVSPPVIVLYPFVCLCTIWHFTFDEKSDCGKINLVLFVISINTILVKLLQIIFGYVTNFVVYICLSLCLYLQKICISHFHIVMAVSYTSHFCETWSSSYVGCLVKEEEKVWGWKKLKFKEDLNLMGDLNIFFLGVT